jgi:hypothetical protein
MFQHPQTSPDIGQCHFNIPEEVNDIPSKLSKGKRIYVPAELYSWLEERAAKTNRSISDVITEIALDKTKA